MKLFLSGALVPLAITILLFAWFSFECRNDKKYSGYVGNVRAMQFMFTVFLPTLFVWLGWIIWGVILWLR